jgi:molybdopterin-containing oxidoreductase family membrane subunit
MSEALGLKPSPVRYFTLLGGIAGGISGLGLSAFAASQWHLITGGRPIFAWIPFVVVGFEFTILLAVLFTVAGMLITSRLPQRVIPNHYDSRFTRDKFGIIIHCPAGRYDEAKALLKGAGAEEVHERKPFA